MCCQKKINFRIIIILLCMFSVFPAIGKDSTGRWSLFVGAKKSWEYRFNNFDPQFCHYGYWEFDYPSVGYHYGVNYDKNNFMIGLRHSMNQRSGTKYENPYSCSRRDSSFSLAFDSLYGKINLHSIELVAGYTFLRRPGVNFSIFGHYCPRAIRGNSHTVGRFFKDSIVYGYVQLRPRQIYGFGINADILLTKRIQIRVGLQFDRIKQGVVAPDKNGNYSPTIPLENNYSFGAKMYGFNMNVVYAL